MNRIYRLVWSLRLNALVVASEHAKRCGKRGGKVKTAMGALIGAALVVGTSQARADSCTVPSATISGAVVDDPCVLDSGESISITGPGSITSNVLTVPFAGVNVSPAIILTGSITSGGIDNAGAINVIGTTNNQSIGIGIATGTLSGGIVNSGTITASGYNGMGIRLDMGATVSNGIDNSGTIDAQAYAISANNGSTVNGGITNSGTLTSDNGAIFLDSSTLNGGFTNSGLIESDNFGLSLRLTDVSGDIVNAQAGVMNVGSTGFHIDRGNIIGSVINHGNINVLSSGYGIRIEDSTITGDITNTGTIDVQVSSYDLAAILIDDSTVNGSINNSGTIQLVTTSEWGYGIYLSSATVTGGITNSGNINVTAASSSSAYGLFLESSAVAGSITNTGTINAIAVDTAYGVSLQSDSAVASISNSGTIEATGDYYAFGVYISSSSVAGGITNAGQISAHADRNADGLQIEGSDAIVGSITNTGSIIGQSTGTDSDSFGTGIRVLNSATVQAIVNQGTITGYNEDTCCDGGGYGIQIDNATVGAISNSSTGSINGTGTVNSFGIYLNNSAVVTNGLTNAGVINGTYASVFDNSGTFGNAASYGLQQILVQGNNTAVFTGDVVAPGAHFIIDDNTTYSSTNAILVDSFTVETTALFNMGVMTSSGELDNGVTVSNGFSNLGIVHVAAGVTGTVNGDYTQAAGATFRLGLTDATSNYGKLSVSGDATLANGSTIDVRLNGSPSIADGAIVAGVISAGGTLTVSPNALIVTDNSLLYSFAASNSRNANELDLLTTLEPEVLEEVVTTYNIPQGKGVAGALTSMLQTGIPSGMQPVFTALNGLSSEEAAAAMEQMLPAVVGAGPQAGLTALHSMNKIIQSRIESNQGLSSGDNPDRYLWLRAFGNRGDQDDLHDVSGFESDTAGLVLGADAPVTDNIRAGIAFTYAKSSIDSNSSNAPSSVDVDTYELVAYGSYNLDPRTDINVQLDVGQNKADSTRRIDFMGTTANASYDSLAYHGSAGIGRLFPLGGDTNVTPSLRLDYTNMTTDSYTEKGAGPLNLDVDEQDFEELLLTADAKFAHPLNRTLKLVGNVSAGYDFLNDQTQTTSTFTGGGPVFVTDGLDVSPWFYRAGVGLISDNRKGLELSLRYDMEGRDSGYLNQTLSARVRWLF